MTLVLVALMSPVSGQGLSSEVFDKAMEELRQPKYTEVTMEVSYYTADDDSMDGLGITASGTVAVEGRTVAMGAEYPLGTVIWMDGHRYVCEDRGGYIVGDRVDVYVEDTETALERGRSMKTVRVEE